MNSDTCCCCIPLKAGVWIIGALELFGLMSTLLQAYWNGQLLYAAATSMLSMVFCVMFLLMMLDKTSDTESLRKAAFYLYLIALVIIPFVVYGLGIFGIGFDFVTETCKEIEDYKARQIPPEEFDDELCTSAFRVSLMVSLMIVTGIKAYFSYILYLWSKKQVPTGYTSAQTDD